MGLSRSSFYYKPKGDPGKKLKDDLELRDKIEEIHLRFPGYGYRRIYKYFLKQGRVVNKKKIRRIMRTFSLFTCLKKYWKPRGTNSSVQISYPNLIKGMKLQAPNLVWASDITYIRLLREYIYLVAIIDIYTRKVVGWAISKDLSHKFCLEALRVAIRRENPPAGIIHHSDHGVQYVCEDYVKVLLENKFQISMSDKGTPDENAFIEAFFKTLKREEVYFKDYLTVRDVLKNLPKFIDEVYNKDRMHSSLGYESPIDFEKKILELKPADRPIQFIWGKVA
jgi:transposase InsO family protein